ncbi:MAG: hypothetical protein Kow002_18620 [Anaerolineales bacterium]
MKKNILIPLTVLIMLGLFLVACQPAVGGEGPAPTKEEQSESAPTPAAEAKKMSGEIEPYIYETLFNAAGEPVLAFGEVTVSEDGLDYIINLRPGVVFHNGNAFNADAVIANFNRWFDPDDALRGSESYDAWVAAFGGFKGEVDESGKPKSVYDGIEKVDELTVLVHLNTPEPDFITKLSDIAFAIISPDALSASAMDGGTGPYMVGELTESGVVLEPNQNYWNPAAIPTDHLEITFGE